MENPFSGRTVPVIEWGQVRDGINKGRMSRIQVLAILLCAVLNAIDGFDIAAMVFTGSTISTQWSLSSAELGILLSSSLFGMVLGSFVLTPVSDWIGRRKAVILSLFLASLGMFWGAYANSYHEFAASRILTGMGVGGIVPALSVIIAEYASDKWRSGAISFMGVGYTAGAMLGGVLGNALLSHYGWRSVFLVGAMLTFALVFAVLAWLPESVDFLVARRPLNALERLNRQLQAMHREPLSMLPLMETRSTQAGQRQSGVRGLITGQVLSRTLRLWAMSFLALASMFFAMSWTPRLLVLSGLSEAQSIMGGVILNGGGVVGCLLFGFVAARGNFKRVTFGYFLVGAVALAAFCMLHSNLTIAFVLTFVIGICVFGGVAGVNTLAPSLYPAAIRGTGVGLSCGVGTLGAIISPVFTGVLLDMGQPAGSLYLYYSIPLLLAAGLAWSLRNSVSSLSVPSTQK